MGRGTASAARGTTALLLAVLWGCASGGGAGGAPKEGTSGGIGGIGGTGSMEPAAAQAPLSPAPPRRTSRQLMVTLAPAPLPLWTRTTYELASDYGLVTLYSWSMSSIGERCIVFEIRSNGRSLDELLRRLTRDPRVRSAEAIQTFETLTDAAPPRHGDPFAHLQRGAHTIGVDQAHRWATGKGVKVAVIDTGVDLDHPDLRGRIAKANNFVDRGEQTFTNDIHGTAVAGVLAATADNDVGIAGTAPDAELFALKACWPQPQGSRRAICDSYTLAKAIDFAIVEKAQILNFSLAGPTDPLLGRLIRAALDRGIAVIAAATDAKEPGFPASVDGVITVLASDFDGNLRSPRSPQSPPAAPKTPMLAAPGIDVLTTVPHGSYDFFTGSSLAAAEVSGVAALLLERDGKLSPAQLAALLHKTARPLHLPGGEVAPGVALIDACAALHQLAPSITCQ
ncbi:MAG TPA: S8 family serine peptidase [Thermoanaerobaculia bacterium]|nr:S8 family serine peptidase [Thermoanaerobaculia bacterium]